MSETSRDRKPAPWVAVRKIVDHPELIGDRMSTGARRGFLLFLVSGIAIQTWALIPSTVPSGIYVALPDMTKVAVAESGSPKRGVETAGPIDVRSVVSTESVSFTMFEGARAGVAPGPQMAANPHLFGTLGEVPVKAKLQALLILLTSRFGDRDVSSLIDKLRALLALPDSALTAVLGLPEMRDLSRLLDAASLGTVDLPRITTEMAKIALTSAPATPYQVQIAVNGRPTASVDMRYVRSDPSAPLAPAAPATAPAPAPVGFVNVEPGVSIVADAITASVMRAVDPVAATPMLAAVAAPEVFAATLETAPTTEPAPAPPPAPMTIAPETFAPTTVTAAPETYSPPTMTAAPEPVASSEMSTPEPTEPTRATVEGDVSATTPNSDDLNPGEDTESHSDEPQGGQDSSPSGGAAESTGTTGPGEDTGGGGGDGPAGGRDASGGNDSASHGDGGDGGSPSS
ncbi:hypothetical protein EUA04_20870 [Mycolicibacterium obuense]|uniref:Uncharacterized protein n=1 Tax=Mycolicibacterium obuense TaxID=1807 RepID=A0A0J6WHZ0_9MYCO|nr:hypothetical protein [Mycolicibacterium obuense]KMO81678.1 hypothetical protein MOBUDSM44075_00245 [Mycolicibacterium obuense]TDL05012.1 hypothetical protein EUA04_20870 [Mycolicibacterium obuense]